MKGLKFPHTRGWLGVVCAWFAWAIIERRKRLDFFFGRTFSCPLFRLACTYGTVTYFWGDHITGGTLLHHVCIRLEVFSRPLVGWEVRQDRYPTAGLQTPEAGSLGGIHGRRTCSPSVLVYQCVRSLFTSSVFFFSATGKGFALAHNATSGTRTGKMFVSLSTGQ